MVAGGGAAAAGRRSPRQRQAKPSTAGCLGAAAGDWAGEVPNEAGNAGAGEGVGGWLQPASSVDPGHAVNREQRREHRGEVRSWVPTQGL